ncbi:ABC transporter ATP-binding protein [Pseudoroseomonas deserti]|uniref:ABC transporter ATP-binding protein n=1 Tax=Teichococcus deserti TaxID=1817963 RepID=A0A1V2H6T1_9PROT|nr:ABC transporter ATP-binding protein [Pseudoroseomonas deserti]ONG58122.1 ABC transporter ATP-binding protein [Pseudoroseomonas deserti]
MSSLQVEELCVAYGKIQALRGISLQVPSGRICALVGANGAGKTTALNAICGLRPLVGGRVLLDGRDIAAVPPHDRVTLGLVQVPEGRRIFGRLTVAENLAMGAFRRRAMRSELQADLDEVLTLFPRLRERMAQLSGTLSGGEQQMLAMGRAMMAKPSLLLLDEPSMGLAPRLVDQIFETVTAINRLGVTVLLVEQNAFMALEIAETAYVLQSGEVVLSGTGAALIDSEAVQEAYLG